VLGGRYTLNRSVKLADPAAVVLRRRVAALDNVTILDGHDVTEFLCSA
jgi:hypothetical protein